LDSLSFAICIIDFLGVGGSATGCLGSSISIGLGGFFDFSIQLFVALTH
jgi:hypothetical protein